jgi:hypothetical protein
LQMYFAFSLNNNNTDVTSSSRNIPTNVYD